MRRQGEAWRGVQDRLDEVARQLNGSSRTASTSDRAEDRLVPQVFAAKITATSLEIPVLGRSWWTYSWVEVERDAAGGTWTTVVSGRDSTKCGVAWNAYETSIDDDGGNIGPATVVRLEYPIDSIVPMWIDPAGRAWFNEANPVEINCDGGSLTQPTIYSGDSPPASGLGIDGDIYFEY